MKYNFGIYDLNDCSDLNYKERILIYKNAGFKELALFLDDQYMKTGENYTEIIDFARSQGLEVKQVHIDYKISNMICDEQSNQYFEYIKQKANECRLLSIPYMVLHASRNDNPPFVSEKQLTKLRNVTRQFLDVNFCFENVRSNVNLEKILNLNEPNIKMCYDLGHAHAFANEFDLFEKFKNYIVCSHLHNNYGKDEHKPLCDGEINYLPIIKKLSEIKNSSNCIEAFPSRGKNLTKEEFETFVKKCKNV